MHIHIRPYSRADLSAMAEIWNEVVRQGEAFPQLETLEAQSAESFFTEQSHCTVAQEDKGSAILGLYILQPCGEQHTPGLPHRRGLGPGLPAPR